jgi:hypothetical protein
MGGFPHGQRQAQRSGTFVVAIGALSALLGLPLAARAQQLPAPLIPVVTPLRGDDLFASQAGPRATTAFAPLRLSLTGGLFSQASAFSGCEARSDASGNSVHGFATQYYSFVRLAPELVLHGYSMQGCAVDAGLGGGLTYAIPLRKSLWLVPSTGFYALPRASGGTPIVSTAARVDLVKQLAWGRTLNVGLGTRSGAGQFSALHFGGSF